MGTTKKALVAEFKQKISSDPRWAVRALLRIYAAQTATEKSMHATVEHNAVGFTAFDADMMTSFADQYLRKGYLSQKQTAITQKVMPKYATQLVRFVQNKG